MLPRVHQGMLAVRVHELAQHPAFATVVQFANRQAELAFPFRRAAQRPAFTSRRSNTSRASSPQSSSPRRAMRRPSAGVQHQYRELRHSLCRTCGLEDVDQVACERRRRRRDGQFDYVLLPTILATGPARMGVAERDARTLVFASNPARLRAMAEGRGGKAEPAADELWQSVDGGLVCAGFPTPCSQNSPRWQLAPRSVRAIRPWNGCANLCTRVLRMGGGFDLDATTNLSAVRVHLGCVNRESAEQLRSMLELWRSAAVAYIEHAVANPAHAVDDDGATKTQTVGDADTERLGAEWYLELIKQCSVEIVEGGEGRVDVRLRSLAPFPPSIMTAYEVAEGGDAKGAARR